MKRLLATLVVLGFACTLCFAAEAPKAPVAVKEPVKTAEAKTEAKVEKAQAKADKAEDKAEAKETKKAAKKAKKVNHKKAVVKQ